MLILAGLLGFAACSSPSTKEQSPEPAKAPVSQELKLENLLTSKLEGVAGTEVVVSRVTMPPNKSLPKHWHPGEEFGYVLEGSVVLWQEGKAEVVGKKGEVIKVPLKQIHTAKTTEEGATILVFRVHEAGKPGRTIVE